MPARTQLLRPTPRNLARIARALERGGIVGVPTETVYGLAGNALEPAACRAIFRAKGRPTDDPLIVHVRDFAQLETVAEVSAVVTRLARAFWPGPLTLVLPKKPIVPDLVTAGLPSVAVRWSAHPVFQAVLARVAFPLAAPSANPFGYISPTAAAHVREHLGGQIPFVLDGGPCSIGVESTILDVRNPRRPVLLRPGAIDRAALARVLGCPVRVPAVATVEPGRAALAPGLLSRHYSPRTPLTLHDRLSYDPDAAQEAWLFFARPRRPRLAPNVFWLAPDRRGWRVAAQRLFAQLRALDRGGWTKIHAERAPGAHALAAAINDRLRRAAARR
jgi:L-threonylcarbamoyladenylate synthase